jgi:hypothetical protein
MERHWWMQPLPWFAEVTLGDKFNQGMEQVRLPVSLRDLTFGYDFNQSAEEGSLQSITLATGSTRS